MTAEFNVLPGLPPCGEPALAFSPTGRGEHSEGLVVQFAPPGEKAWVGNFRRGLTSFDEVRPHPNDRDVLVVAGGLGYVVDPFAKKVLSIFGGAIEDSFPHPTLRAVVFNHQYIGFEAIGVAGSLWNSRVSWDGMRSLAITDSIIRGEAWSPIENTWLRFQLDLDTGAVLGGSYPGGSCAPVEKPSHP